MIVTRTPFRVSFFGGGTDYPEHFEKHGGAVLATAMDKSLFLNATHFYSGLFDYSIRLAYRKVECVRQLNDIEHFPMREILRACGIEKDIEISLAAELPSFSGIGSSSSFVVGMLNTIAAFQGRYVKPIELAYEAIRIEREVLNECVGCQDQVLAAIGGFHLVEFRSRDNITTHRVTMSSEVMKEFEDHLLMVYTGLRRRASEQASRQVARIDMNREALLAIRKMVDESYEALVGTKNFERFGKLLHRSWQIKRELESSISNNDIDDLYTKAFNAGAWGGKLLGAGGGGFLLFVVPPDRRPEVMQAMGNVEQVPIKIDAAGSQILFAS